MNIDTDWVQQGINNLFSKIKQQNLEAKGWPFMVLIFLLLTMGYSIYVSQIPEAFALDETQANTKITGSATTATLAKSINIMLHKKGGYISNDVLPPMLFLDNIKNWEFGVLVQARDLSLALRNDFSRSQSQSIEDKDLKIAQPQLHFDSASWVLPATESEYQQGLDALNSYHQRLSDSKSPDAQFFSRADNLRTWLGQVEKRLGSLSQRLSASVGQIRINTDLAGDSSALQSTEVSAQIEVKTPWSELDDVFYEARGSAWALTHYLKAIEVDFAGVLEKKNALISLRQIIRELESSQQALWSPMILNGSGFGLFANHSLVMASYISRANSALIDLRQLLLQG